MGIMRRMETAAAVFGAYLLGSVSFAILVSRLFALPDPRSYGSGNPGATNVLRTGKKLAAALTLAGDAGKGWLAVWLAGLYAAGAAPLAGLAVFLGHLFPVFHRFKGGKGVATAAGVVFAFDWRLGLGAAGTWLVIAVFFRYASLASVVAAVFAGIFAFFPWFGLGTAAAVPLIIALLLIWRHRDNLARLARGEEKRIGEKAPAS
jgi:glycerol-3-phosphate acyltransferase PlsY